MVLYRMSVKKERLKMPRVLITDDAAFMRVVLRKILEKEGFEVVGEATTGEEAIEKYKELKPDIVTMDITMPSMNGIVATEEIIAYDPNAKVVICSAIGQRLLVLDSIKAGAKDFIVKPFTNQKVSETLWKLMS